jgi:hypothetical protein
VAQQRIGLFAAGRNSLRVLWRAARELFYEVAGVIFFAISLSAVQSAWRAWQKGAARWMVGVSAGYALLMILFGFLSFRDSRRVR